MTLDEYYQEELEELKAKIALAHKMGIVRGKVRRPPPLNADGSLREEPTENAEDQPRDEHGRYTYKGAMDNSSLKAGLEKLSGKRLRVSTYQSGGVAEANIEIHHQDTPTFTSKGKTYFKGKAEDQVNHYGSRSTKEAAHKALLKAAEKLGINVPDKGATERAREADFRARTGGHEPKPPEPLGNAFTENDWVTLESGQRVFLKDGEVHPSGPPAKSVKAEKPAKEKAPRVSASTYKDPDLRLRDESLNHPDVIKNLKIPEFLYHVTHRDNRESIEKTGLRSGKPRASELGEIAGVYLTSVPEDIGRQGGDINTRDTVVMKVSTKGLNLRLDPEYFYYKDSSHQGAKEYIDRVNKDEEGFALYSRQNIPASHVTYERVLHNRLTKRDPVENVRKKGILLALEEEFRRREEGRDYEDEGEDEPLGNAFTETEWTQIENYDPDQERDELGRFAGGEGTHYVGKDLGWQEVGGTRMYLDEYGGQNKSPPIPDPLAKGAASGSKPAKQERAAPEPQPTMKADKSIGKAYYTLSQFKEHEDGLVPVDRLYHEAKRDTPDLTVKQFKDHLQKMWDKREISMHAINEVRQLSKEQKDKGITKGESHYHYVFWDKNRSK